MAKQYEKTRWVNEQTPLNAENLNKIEQGISDAIETSNTNETKLNSLDSTLKDLQIDYISKTQELEESLESKASVEDLGSKASKEELENRLAEKVSQEQLASELAAKASKEELFDRQYNSLFNKPNIPNKVSDLSNDSGFITSTTKSLTNYFTKEEVSSLINIQPHINMVVVDTLPTENISSTTIYLLNKTNSDDSNTKEEYIYINNKWELIGNTNVKVDGFVTEEQVDSKITSAITSLLTNKY